MLKMLQAFKPSVGVNVLLDGAKLRRDELLLNAKEAISFGEVMTDVHWMGLRELFARFCPALMSIVMGQAEYSQQHVCVSPLDILYYLRQSKPGDTTLAKAKMLETICKACAATAEKTGQELLDVVVAKVLAAQILHFEG